MGGHTFDGAGQIPVGAVPHLHANPSPALVGDCDVPVTYDTYPHMDMREVDAKWPPCWAACSAARPCAPWHASCWSCPLAQATDVNPMRPAPASGDRPGPSGRAAPRQHRGRLRVQRMDGAGMSVLIVHKAGQEATAASVMEATVAESPVTAVSPLRGATAMPTRLRAAPPVPSKGGPAGVYMTMECRDAR
jgi:hypothetical protein